MPPKKKVKEKEDDLSLEGVFEKQLATAGLADSLTVVDAEDDSYECVSTGWPGVDTLITPALLGLPKHVHVEIFSELEHVGKTTLALQTGVAWQKQGLKVAIIQIETRIHSDYLHTLGYVTDKAEAEELGIYAVRLLQPKINPKDCSTDMVYVEQILDIIGLASNYFDLIIVDSVDALVSQADSAKPSDEGSTMGGVSKPIKNFFRKHTVPIATIIWINHLSKGLGQYARDYTSGGKAIPRYSTIRFKLDRVSIVSEGDKDPYGFITKITTVKNRVSAPFRSTNLYYIFGEGFSVEFEYYQAILKAGLVLKSGSWYYIPGEGKNDKERKENSTWKTQGMLETYRRLRNEDTELFNNLKTLIDGEDVSELDASELLKTAEEAKAAEDEEALESLAVEV